MANVKTIYYGMLTVLAALGTMIAEALGGWDMALQTLLTVMAIDYCTGIACALIWKKSPKSENGAFESKASIKGLFRKMCVLACVLLAYRLDLMAGTTVIRNGVMMFFIANDGFSIVENLGTMGVDFPEPLANAFEALRTKTK